MIGNMPGGIPINGSGGVPVNPQDQTTQLVPAIFAQSGTDFDLASDTVPSTIDTINTKIYVAHPNTLAVNDVIILLDVIGDVSVQAKIVAKTVDTPAAGTDEIDLDTPIDHIFPAATAITRTTLIDLAVDGAASTEIFTVRAGAVPRDFLFWTLTVDHDAATDGSLFCGGSALSRGLIVRLFNGVKTTLFNIKKDADVLGYKGMVMTVPKVGGGSYTTVYTIPFRDAFGVVLRLKDLEVVQTIPQNDLSGANYNSILATMGGHVTQGEV